MALQIHLKPHEKIVIGQSVITNGDQRTRFSIEGTASILRAKDIMQAADADTPAKRIYLCLQSMYLANDPAPYHPEYFELTKAFITAAPSALPQVDRINNLILTNDLYKTLRAARALITYEEELMGHASGGTTLSVHPAENPDPTSAGSRLASEGRRSA